MSLDVEAALKDSLKMKDEEFAEYFVVDEVAGNIEIALRKNSKGRPIWLEHGTWIGVNKYVKDKDGKWDKTQSKWFISLEKIKQPKPSVSIDTPQPSGPIPIEQPREEMSTAADMISVTSDKIMVANIPLRNLELNVFSPRMQFDTKYIAKLAEDIEAEGQLKPIVVRPHSKDPNKYQVIDGEHRVRAIQKLGRTLVRAEIHALTDEEAYYRAMRINQLHGKCLEELEEAIHINKMMAIFGFTEEQMAKRLNRPQSWISQRRSLAVKIAHKVEHSIITRVIKPRHGIEMSLLPKEDQEKVVEKVAAKRLSTRATRGLVQAIKKASTAQQKEEILSKPLDLYAAEFKDPQTLEKALLTIKPEDDFLAKAKEIKTEEQAKELFEEAYAKRAEPVETQQCPGCGKQLRIDWVKRTLTWD